MPQERPLTALQLMQLSANLNPERVVKLTKGKGPALSYLESWEIRTNLIRIFGYGGFSEETSVQVQRIEDGVPNSRGGTQFRVTVLAHVKITIPQLGVSYQEAAAASQNNPDIGEAMDFAVKTAESDALKRAVINLGTQFGLSLYNKGATLDVVKIVREPYQAAILKRLSAGEKPSEIDLSLARTTGGQGGAVDVEEPIDERDGTPSPHEWSPEELEAEANRVDPQPAPGESPQEDQPMALDIPVDPQARADATAAVRRGFDRKR